ncbi:MAG TPA: aspartate aminotransferase family protein [Terriglobales bacterium]|jgi:acetylornithine/N-succinyldiaminopimelate aminotransferase
METFEQIVEREKQYLIQTYARYPRALASGKGVWVFDIEGRKYLDLVGGLGVNALGHAHKRIVKVIREQCVRLIHVSNLYYNEYQGLLAERLCKLSGMERAFFCNSGTEAIEGAIKAARAAGHAVGGEAKNKLFAIEGSFHGRTFGALSLTAQEKYRKDFTPLLEGVQFIKLNDADDLYSKIDDTACAIVIEPIQGEGGIRECTQEFLQEARTVADRHKVALIFDEIQCGLGRTGSMFAYQDSGVTPDIVTIAKPLAAGLPLGAFLAREPFASAIGSGKHGTTFGGGPLACRVALEYLSIIEEEGLLENVRKVGAYLNHELNRTRVDFDVVREVRGRGMIQALELNVPARPFVDAAIQKGLLINATQDVVIRLLPAFLLEEKHVDKAMKVLRKLLANRPVEIAAHSRAGV